nr:hypothetical protein [uncultured Sunxiuqinia sp.]
MGATISIGKMEERPALSAPVINKATANFPASGSRVVTISNTFIVVFSVPKIAPAAHIITDVLIIKIRIPDESPDSQKSIN